MGRRCQPVWSRRCNRASGAFWIGPPVSCDRRSACEALCGFWARLSETAEHGTTAEGATVVPSLLLGVATGFLWAPCAGPVLGLILPRAALQGASVETSLLLLTFAAGAATSLGLALVAGGRAFAAMKRSLGAGEWIRRGLGVAGLVCVAGIALGVHTRFLTPRSSPGTGALVHGVLD